MGGPKWFQKIPGHTDNRYVQIGEQVTVCDFDWGHEHTNTDGTKFQNGVAHVQFYHSDAEGNRVRLNQGDARYMNNAEIIKYRPIIRHFNPYVKFGV